MGETSLYCSIASYPYHHHHHHQHHLHPHLHSILIVITIFLSLYTPLWAPPIILSPRKCRNLLPGQGVYLGPATPSKQDDDDNDNDDIDARDDSDDGDDGDDDNDKMTMKISVMVLETMGLIAAPSLR